MSLNAAAAPPADAERLAEFLANQPRLAVLTGAGCSTASGIPVYRDDAGNWVHRQPMQYADFVGRAERRQRYWAQSFAGWERIAAAEPNAAHRAIAGLERLGKVHTLITQNVDNLHRAAGSRNVVDLHGVLDRVRCLDCGRIDSRHVFQARLMDENPHWAASLDAVAPDGDARLAGADFARFRVPDCGACGGIVKPHVVFFGEAVPAERVAEANRAIEEADALLVVGSSLMVFSGFRFARLAAERGKPIAIVNRGVTRADELATARFACDCAALLAAAMTRLGA